MNKVILNPGKETSLLRFHPWVFSGAIKKIVDSNNQSVTTEEGELVEIYSSKNEYLATGHCAPGSIAVRCITFEKTNIDYNFWLKKIESAYQLRKSLGLTDNKKTNVYRLINAEGDGLPGLIVDVYDDCAVIQAHSVGMFIILETIAKALKQIYGTKLTTIYNKSEETLSKKSELSNKNSFLLGDKGETIVLENGHKFGVDWLNGQKTGFFIDQRENRELLARYSSNKKVLNTFCYTGGFSVYALAAGATEVHSVDSSKRAIELTDKNIALNFGETTKHQSFAVDTFDFLKDRHNYYDVIVLDPPAFAKHKDAKHNAINGYKRLNAEAFSQIKSGGILFTFSCSQIIDKNLFNSTVMSAAIQTKRKVRILHQLHQPCDHPINIFHPENEYLKGLVLQVE